MSIDLLILLLAFSLFAIITYQYGKSFLIAFILSFYPTYFLFDLLNQSYVNSKEPVAIIGLFAISLAVMLYVRKKTVVAGFSMNPLKRTIDAVILSLGALAQCALVYYYVLPQLAGLYTLSSVVGQFFQTTVPYSILALIPFVALLISARD